MANYIISPTGNNANPGTLASPKAISWLNNLVAGDVAELRGGIYNAQVSLDGKAGTAANKITIKQYLSEQPILDGGWNNTLHPLQSPGNPSVYEYDAIFKLSNCQHINVSGIKVQNSDGQAFRVSDSDQIFCDNLKAETIYGMGFNCTGGGTTVTNTNITLKNSDFLRTCQAWKWFRQTINGTLIYNIPSSIFFARGTTDCLIENCTLELAGAEGFVAARGSRRITFRKCVSVNNRHNLYYLGFTQESVIEECIGYFTAAGLAEIPSMRKQGIILRDEDGAYNQGFYPAFSSRDNTVRNCLIIHSGLGYQGYGDASMVRFHLHDNTFVNCLQNILNRTVRDDRPTPVGNIFENNIFYNGEPYTSNPLYDPAENLGNNVVSSQGATYRNNLWYNTNGNARPANAAGTNDVVNQDPQMLNPQISLEGVSAIQFRDGNYALNYEPQAGSPAIDAGSPTGTTTDLLGRSYIGTGDIGALESGATSGGDCAGNILTNGDFSGGATGWTETADGIAQVESGEYHVSGTTAVSPFNQVLQGGLNVISGQKYRVTFSARRVGTSSQLGVSMLQDNTPFANLGLNAFFDITQTMAEYVAVFTANANEADARFRFRFNSGEFFIDDVCVEPFDGIITAAFTLSSNSADIGETISFTNTSTSDSGISTAVFDWGDGTQTTLDPAIETIADHAWSASGTYTVTLTVTGPDGTDTTTEIVVVSTSQDKGLPEDIACDTGIGRTTRGVAAPGDDSTRTDQLNSGGTRSWTSGGTLATSSNFAANQRKESSIVFSGISIPAGATILTAKIRLNVIATTGFAVDPFGIYATSIESANFQPPTSLAEFDAMMGIISPSGNFANIPNGTTGWIDVTGLTQAVQDVIDLPGWAEGNNIGFYVGDLGGDDGSVTYHSYDTSPLLSPELWITYECDVVRSYGPSFGAVEFVMDSVGNVTQLSSHPEPIHRVLNRSSFNYLGFYDFSFNIFTGLGQATESCGCRTLLFNIDTGNYEIVDTNGDLIASGTNDAGLQAYGNRHHVDPDSGISFRGQAYWDWAEGQHAITENNYTAQAWPDLFEEQYQKAQAL